MSWNYAQSEQFPTLPTQLLPSHLRVHASPDDRHRTWACSDFRSTMKVDAKVGSGQPWTEIEMKICEHFTQVLIFICYLLWTLTNKVFSLKLLAQDFTGNVAFVKENVSGQQWGFAKHIKDLVRKFSLKIVVFVHFIFGTHAKSKLPLKWRMKYRRLVWDICMCSCTSTMCPTVVYTCLSLPLPPQITCSMYNDQFLMYRNSPVHLHRKLPYLNSACTIVLPS